MVTDALQVGVLIEDCVVDVQEQVEGILVQEVDLTRGKKHTCTQIQINIQLSHLLKSVTLKVQCAVLVVKKYESSKP